MWVVGALLGLIVGSLFHLHGSLLGALAGGMLGWWYTNRQQQNGLFETGVLKRLELIEAQVQALQDELGRLRQRDPSGQPASASQGSKNTLPVHPVQRDAEPRRPPTESVSTLPKSPTKSVHDDWDIAQESLFEHGLSIEMPVWLKRLWEGNPLAKIGIVLLFFGIASGLKLAAEYGLMPVPLRLFIAATLGIGLIVFGMTKVRGATQSHHRTFGLAIQGGGFALLYLVGYFMLARYAMVGEGPAFGLFAILGVACVIMAARQDGPALAVLGLSGAFLAPVLAGGHADFPLGLFSYFALLNVFILSVDWFKSWRVLNSAGFILTLVIGMAWGMEGYEARHYGVTQAFLILFLMAYSAMPAATALFRAPGFQGWQDGMLLFGAPLIGGLLQSRLMEGSEYGLAWSALIGSVWYFALWVPLLRRPESEIRLLERSHLGLAIAFLTLSIPLAFGTQITSAFWAAEGTAVLWFGIRTKRILSQATGMTMQLAAGIALAAGWNQLDHALPIANDALLGGFILALGGILSACLLRRLGNEASLPPILPFIWAMAWWLGGGFGEIERFTPASSHIPYELLFATATVAGLEAISRGWNWPQLRASSLILLVGMVAATLGTLAQDAPPFAGHMAWVLPVAIALHYLLLAAHEKSKNTPFLQIRHLAAGWLILALIPLEISWRTQQMAANVPLWPFMAWAIVLAGGIALAVLGKNRIWPFTTPSAGYIPVGVAPPAIALFLLLAWSNTHLTGAMGNLELPYLPVLNLFDVTQLLGMSALILLVRVLDKDYRRPAFGFILGLGFLWISTLAARLAHHRWDIPFEWSAMLGSSRFQALLTLFWTISAITTMILASRQMRREAWFAGFSLLGIVGAKLLLFDAADRGTLTWTATLIGVALLVLAASYFAPVPPRSNNRP